MPSQPWRAQPQTCQSRPPKIPRLLQQDLHSSKKVYPCCPRGQWLFPNPAYVVVKTAPTLERMAMSDRQSPRSRPALPPSKFAVKGQLSILPTLAPAAHSTELTFNSCGLRIRLMSCSSLVVPGTGARTGWRAGLMLSILDRCRRCGSN